MSRSTRNASGVAPVVGTRGASPDWRDDRQGTIGVELLHFAKMLSASSNIRQLEQRFIEGFGRSFDLPMYALYTVDPWTAGPQRIASVRGE